MLMLVFYSSLGAQSIMSFKECLEMALTNNPEIKKAQINEQISYSQFGASKMNLLPNLNARGSNYKYYGRGIDPNTNEFIDNRFNSYSAGLGSSVTLFNGFAQLNSIKLSKQEVEMVRANVQWVKNNVTIDLASKYTSILFVEELIKAKEEQLQGTFKQIKLLEEKFEAGYISESELFKLKSQSAKEELELTTNKNRYSLLMLELRQLMNIPLEKDIRLMKLADALKDYSVLKIDDNSYLGSTVILQPNYQIAKMDIERNKIMMDLKKSPFLPTLSAGLNLGSTYSSTDQNLNFSEQFSANQSYYLYFSLEVPIFNRFQNIARLKQSKLAIKAAMFEFVIQTNEESRILLKALNDAKAARKNYESARFANKFADKSYQADLQKFELGKIDFNSFNTTKVAFIDSQTGLIQAKYELLFNLALLKFYQGQGFEF